MVGLDVTHQALDRRRARRASCAPPAASGTFVAELVDFYARFHRAALPGARRLADARPGRGRARDPARARRRRGRRTSRSTAAWGAGPRPHERRLARPPRRPRAERHVGARHRRATPSARSCSSASPRSAVRRSRRRRAAKWPRMAQTQAHGQAAPEDAGARRRSGAPKRGARGATASRTTPSSSASRSSRSASSSPACSGSA